MAEENRDPEGKGSGVDPLLAQELEGEGWESKGPESGAAIVFHRRGETEEDVARKIKWLETGGQATNLESYLSMAPKVILMKRENLEKIQEKFLVGCSILYPFSRTGAYLYFIDKNGDLVSFDIDFYKITSYNTEDFDANNQQNYEKILSELRSLGFSCRYFERNLSFHKIAREAHMNKKEEEKRESQAARREEFNF